MRNRRIYFSLRLSLRPNIRLSLRPSLLMLALALAACAAQPNALSGTVTVSFPPEGAVIYASALHVAGTLADVPEQALLVRVVDANGGSLSETPLTARGGAWSLDIIHGYSGEARAVTVEVRAAAEPDAGVMASARVTLAALEHRPEGAFVDVISPQDGMELGGDLLEIHGRVSGYETVRVALVGSDGTVIASGTAENGSPYRIDEIPWRVELPNPGFTGTASLTVYGDDTLAQRLTVIMSAAAG